MRRVSRTMPVAAGVAAVFVSTAAFAQSVPTPLEMPKEAPVAARALSAEAVTENRVLATAATPTEPPATVTSPAPAIDAATAANEPSAPAAPAPVSPPVEPAQAPVPTVAAASSAEPKAPPPAPVSVSTEPAPKVEPPVTAEAPPAPVLNEVVAAVRELLKRGKLGPSARERDEWQALIQFYDKRNDAPVWTDATGIAAAGKAVVDIVAKADDWGLRARDFDLPARTELSGTAVLAEAELRIATAALRYARHARGGRVDPLELSDALDRKGTFVPPRQLLDTLAQSDAPDAVLLKLHPQHPQFERLRKKLVALRSAGPDTQPQPQSPPASEKKAKKGEAPAAPPPPRVTEKKILANMEMWRWMPLDLGSRYIFANVPEFQFRYMKDGKAIHTERIITGKVETQTPIFSDLMEHIIFNPTWNVPDSIKVKELLPGLVRGGDPISRQGLKATLDGRPIDPGSVDWRAVDIRRMHVFQPSGERNALGTMKFMFPNKHHVYMHDTPTKPLFNSASRTFSHGCVRVRNPLRYAEVILAEDKGWGPDKVKSQLDSRIENNQVNLTTKIPVHLAYFTVWVEDDGKATAYRDVYGYEDKIHLGLDGKAHLIVKKKDDLGQFRADVVGRLSENSVFGKSSPNALDWIKQIFGN